MRYFDKNRRRLIKPYYVRGLKKTMTGTSKVLLESSVKAHIPYIEVMGNTVQNGTPTPEAPIPIQNANDNGMCVILRGENLFNAQGDISNISNIVNFSFGNNFIKKTNVNPAASDSVLFAKEYPAGIYTLSLKTTYSKTGGYTIRFLSNKKYEGGVYNSHYKAYYKDIVTQADPNTSFTVTLGENAMVGFAIAVDTDFGTMNITDIMLTPTSQAVEYKPYVEETVEIPTSVGTLTTELTEYDKLTVDRLNNKVVFTNGSHTYKYKGTEYIEIDQWASGLGYGNYYRTYVTTAFDLTDVIACTHFKKGIWTQSVTMKTQMNVVCPASNYLFFFKTDGVQSLDEFKAFLQEQYANGTPVTLLTKRRTPVEHDITSTDLGQALLSLATRQGTNYLEIVGDLEPSTLNVTYYSESEQDQVDLTIKYMCGEKEIKDPRVQEIRRGSKYLIVAPHINGYTRISSEVYGVADESTTIELIYKEEEDATI